MAVTFLEFYEVVKEKYVDAFVPKRHVLSKTKKKAELESGAIGAPVAIEGIKYRIVEMKTEHVLGRKQIIYLKRVFLLRD